MTRFIAGIAVAITVQLLGWPRIESAFRKLGAGRSAHLVIDTDGKVTQCVEFNRRAAHAGGGA